MRTGARRLLSVTYQKLYPTLRPGRSYRYPSRQFPEVWLFVDQFGTLLAHKREKRVSR